MIVSIIPSPIGGVTHIQLDNESPQWGVWVEEGTQLIRNLDYGKVSLEQIQALIDASVFCKQYLKLDCYNYEIWDGETSRTWWMNKDLEKRDNWGTDTGVTGCACSTTNGKTEIRHSIADVRVMSYFCSPCRTTCSM